MAREGFRVCFMMSKGKKILITGSSGFLGRHLVDFLQRAGHRVTGIDFFELPQSAVQPQNFILHDLRLPLHFEVKDFDVYIHLASGAGGILRNNTQVQMLQDDISILKQLRSLHKSGGCRQLLFFSSMNVFERTPEFSEASLEKMNQQTPYAKAKAMAERFIESNFRDFCIIRSTNFFGPDQPHYGRPYGQSNVIPDLTRKILEDAEVEVFGDGSQMRNFLHVSDVCDLVLKTFDLRGSNYFHLRSNLFLSIRELVQSLMTFYGLEKKVSFSPEYLKYEALPVKEFETVNAQRLGWAPKQNSLYEGLGCKDFKTKGSKEVKKNSAFSEDHQKHLQV